MSIDFFTVPTMGFQVLYVFLVLAHDRRRIVHCNVTAHPTAEWTGQQLREAFPFDQLPRYLLRDRDAIFGDAFRGQVRDMGIHEVLCTPRSPCSGLTSSASLVRFGASAWTTCSCSTKAIENARPSHAKAGPEILRSFMTTSPAAAHAKPWTADPDCAVSSRPLRPALRLQLTSSPIENSERELLPE